MAREVPDRYGPWKSVYNRFARWRDDGTRGRVLATLRVALDDAGLIDHELWLIDGTGVRADRSAAGSHKMGATPASRPTTRWAAAAAAGARSSTWSLTAAAIRWPRR